jgi:putative hydrolase of the HAD superfamily
MVASHVELLYMERNAREISPNAQVAINRDLVVLDVGGVLFTDITISLMRTVVQATSCTEEAVSGAFEPLEKDLWCGLISTDQFWRAFGDKLNCHLDSNFWDEECVKLQKPLLSEQSLSYLLAKCDVALLTNHRTEWLFPALKEVRLKDSFCPIVVSAIEGCMKPDPRIYEVIDNVLPRHYGRRLFIDDRPINLKPAEHLGYQVMLADPRQDWETAVVKWAQTIP